MAKFARHDPRNKKAGSHKQRSKDKGQLRIRESRTRREKDYWDEI